MTIARHFLLVDLGASPCPAAGRPTLDSHCSKRSRSRTDISFGEDTAYVCTVLACTFIWKIYERKIDAFEVKPHFFTRRIDEISQMFGGLDVCSLEAVVNKDGKEFIIEVNDSATTLMGESQEEDRRQIAELVIKRMEVRIRVIRVIHDSPGLFSGPTLGVRTPILRKCFTHRRSLWTSTMSSYFPLRSLRCVCV